MVGFTCSGHRGGSIWTDVSLVYTVQSIVCTLYYVTPDQEHLTDEADMMSPAE